MKLLKLSLIVLALLVLAAAGHADGNPNKWVLLFVTGAGDPYSTYCASDFFGVLPTSNDNYDGEHGGDSPIFTLNPSAVYAATYHSNVSDGWTGPDGFYGSDMRGPISLDAGASKSWLIYVWATPEVPAAASSIELSIDRFEPDFLPLDQYSFRLSLVSKPQDIVGGPNVGTTWELGPGGIGLQLPIYRADNGLTGYQFELTATAVPEPPSILALLCGLGGVAGLVVRGRNGGR